jgi:hypothetical protein
MGSILADFEIPERPSYLAVAPISHVAGTKVSPTLMLGGTVQMLKGFDPEAVLAAIAREGIGKRLKLLPLGVIARVAAQQCRGGSRHALPSVRRCHVASVPRFQRVMLRDGHCSDAILLDQHRRHTVNLLQFVHEKSFLSALFSRHALTPPGA